MPRPANPPMGRDIPLGELSRRADIPVGHWTSNQPSNKINDQSTPLKSLRAAAETVLQGRPSRPPVYVRAKLWQNSGCGCHTGLPRSVNSGQECTSSENRGWRWGCGVAGVFLPGRSRPSRFETTSLQPIRHRQVCRYFALAVMPTTFDVPCPMPRPRPCLSRTTGREPRRRAAKYTSTTNPPRPWAAPPGGPRSQSIRRPCRSATCSAAWHRHARSSCDPSATTAGAGPSGGRGPSPTRG